MTNQRLSKLQRIILEELASYRDSKTADVSGLSFAVAKRYAPEKMWRLEDVHVKRPEIYAFCRSLHRKGELIRNEFSASFSRSLRSLEEKGLLQLVRGKYFYKDDGWYYRIYTTQPRITFVVHYESPYFGKKDPDIEFIIDIVNSMREKIRNHKVS
jgi:hypothetical protein